jgi:hypothetical protein
VIGRFDLGLEANRAVDYCGRITAKNREGRLIGKYCPRVAAEALSVDRFRFCVPLEIRSLS